MNTSTELWTPDHAETLHVGTRQMLMFQLRCLARELPSAELRIGDDQDHLRMYVSQGTIAWTHHSLRGRYLSDVLSEQVGLDLVRLRRLVQECRAAQRNFGEFLVERHILDFPALRRCLLLHIHEHIACLFESVSFPTQICMTPRTHRYDARLTFSVDEVFGPET